MDHDMLPTERRKEKHRKRLLESNETLRKDIQALNENGYIIIPNLLSVAQISLIKKEADRILEPEKLKDTFFEDHRKNAYSLVAKSRIFDILLLHPRILDICDYYLYKNYLLAVATFMQLFNNKGPQPFHEDAGNYLYREKPTKNPLRIQAMWAIDDFTENNGSTLVIPKSHLWHREREIDYKNDIIKKAIMKKGSVLIYLGSTYHAGGHNVSGKPRTGAGIGYVQPWIRPQENNLLAVPLDQLNKIPNKLQQLIGYSRYRSNGMVDGQSPKKYVKKLLDHYRTAKL